MDRLARGGGGGEREKVRKGVGRGVLLVFWEVLVVAPDPDMRSHL